MKTSKLVVDEVPIEEWHCQSLSGMLGGYTGVYHFTSQNKPLFHKFNSSIATRLLTVDLTHAMAKRIPWIYIYIYSAGLELRMLYPSSKIFKSSN